MRKLPKTQMRAWATRHLQVAQGGVCAICKREIDMATRGNATDYVVDHDHITGEIRGVLHRGCNGMEGKVFAAVARWGGTGNDYERVKARLRELLEYLDTPGTGMIYYTHKTPEERAEAERAKRRVQAAASRARAAVKRATR